jgi:cell shape-determining protein MreD
MRWPRFAVLVLIITLLQASWVDKIAITRFNAAPDLLLTAMVFFAIRCNPTEAIISSFVLGFASDIVSTGFRMGPGIIAFGLFGTALTYMQRVITVRRMGLEALAILVVGFGVGGLTRLLAMSSGPGGFGVLAGTSIYSAVVGPFLFLLLDLSMGIRSRRSAPALRFWRRKK